MSPDAVPAFRAYTWRRQGWLALRWLLDDGQGIIAELELDPWRRGYRLRCGTDDWTFAPTGLWSMTSTLRDAQGIVVQRQRQRFWGTVELGGLFGAWSWRIRWAGRDLVGADGRVWARMRAAWAWASVPIDADPTLPGLVPLLAAGFWGWHVAQQGATVGSTAAIVAAG